MSFRPAARMFFEKEPSLYDFLDYVYNNGHISDSSHPDGYGAYVNTGFTPYKNIDVSCDFKIFNRAMNNTRTAIFGELQTSVFNSASFCFQEFTAESDWSLITSGTNHMNTGVSLSETHVNILGGTEYEITTNGHTNIGSIGSPMTNGVGPLYYGCTYYQGSNGPVWHGDMNLGRFTIKDSSSKIVLVDLIPCRRKSDGVYGFWDAVNRSFVGSSNGYSFGGKRT